ncbi:XRE family transcriptional regulator [Dorea longicatena]|uniref:XRE family transcriptional regulator n=2 Tax=Lachnospiraceae TaxID=186803 RepID=A0A414S0Z4_9FIRM|nr:XRE family transcriptional regulator [Dorea longicatena]
MGGEKMTDIDPIELGERIKKQRLLLGYSREKLAELADITPRFCYDLELGLKNMSVNTLLKLSTALHVSVDYLLHGSTQETNYYSSLFSLIETCPKRDLAHLEQIISHYIQAVRNDKES